MALLAPCRTCRRHVRRDEHVCPHCGISLPWVAIALTASLGLMGCKSTPSSDSSTQIWPEGRPALDAPVDASAPPHPPKAMPVYGPPAIDVAARRARVLDAIRFGDADLDGGIPRLADSYGPAPFYGPAK